jgi:MFS family permease
MSPKHPGGCWGWCVATASFITHTIVGGICYSGAVWLMILRRYFDCTRHEIAWLGAFLLAMATLGGIPSTLLSYKLGYRGCVIVGGALASSGFALAYFCKELHELYLCIGILAGLGLGLALTPSVMAIEGYFNDDNQRRLASGFAATGTSLGIAVFPLIVYNLEEVYAWKGISFLLVGVCANLIPCGAVMWPVKETDGTKPHKWKNILKIFEPVLFRSVAFNVILISNFLWSAGASVVMFNLPEYALSTGISMDNAVQLLVVAGSSSLISRVIFQLFSHSAKLDAASNCLCSAGLTIILTGLFPEFFQHQAGEISYAIIFGLHAGFWSTFVGAVSDELITGELLAFGRGYLTLSIGMGFTVGLPLSALLLDRGCDYEVLYYTAGALMLVSSILMLIINIKKCYYRPAIDIDMTDSSNSSLSHGSQLSTESPIPSKDKLATTSLLTPV